MRRRTASSTTGGRPGPRGCAPPNEPPFQFREHRGHLRNGGSGCSGDVQAQVEKDEVPSAALRIPNGRTASMTLRLSRPSFATPRPSASPRPLPPRRALLRLRFLPVRFPHRRCMALSAIVPPPKFPNHAEQVNQPRIFGIKNDIRVALGTPPDTPLEGNK